MMFRKNTSQNNSVCNSFTITCPLSYTLIILTSAHLTPYWYMSDILWALPYKVFIYSRLRLQTQISQVSNFL